MIQMSKHFQWTLDNLYDCQDLAKMRVIAAMIQTIERLTLISELV